MPVLKKRSNFFDSEEGMEAKKVLSGMEADKAYNTEASYSADTVNYPNNLISFVDKHMAYLNTHPNLNPLHYIANLQLITRIK